MRDNIGDLFWKIIDVLLDWPGIPRLGNPDRPLLGCLGWGIGVIALVAFIFSVIDLIQYLVS